MRGQSTKFHSHFTYNFLSDECGFSLALAGIPLFKHNILQLPEADVASS